MTKFKVGDTVKIKDNLIVDEEYDGGCTFRQDMKEYIGKIAKITDARDYPYGNRYNIDLDGGFRSWSNSMFEPPHFELSDIKFADIVTLRNGERYVVADNYLHGEEDDYYCDCDCLDDCYKKDLTRDSNCKEYDIVKVERDGNIMFERTDSEIKEMTVKEICDALGYEIKIKKED